MKQRIDESISHICSAIDDLVILDTEIDKIEKAIKRYKDRYKPASSPQLRNACITSVKMCVIADMAVEAIDGINEMLRPLSESFIKNGKYFLVDWRFGSTKEIKIAYKDEYKEGNAFDKLSEDEERELDAAGY